MEKEIKEIYYYLAFSYFYGIGPIRFLALLKHFQTAKKAYEADKDQLAKVIGQSWAEKFVKFRVDFDPAKKIEELKQKKIAVVPLGSDFYPQSLQEISDPPICLYVKGDYSLLNNRQNDLSISHKEARCQIFRFEEHPSKINSSLKSSKSASSPLKNLPSFPIFFAIVGTRKPTVYGQQVTRKFAFELAEAGFIIVSGMAIGIDTIAHQTALEAGGKTVAVLGCGVDVVYPAVNRHLYEEIIKKGGLIISEFPPGTYVEKGLFVARNRIISGLSKGVLIVEGLKDSGALITARYAAEQGKEVFAPPSPITSAMSQAPNLLLRQGAKLVTSVEDIYEELGVKILPKKKEEMENRLSDEEKIIFSLLQEKPLLADEISLLTKKTVAEILNTISVLEIKGVVEKNSEGKYQLRY